MLTSVGFPLCLQNRTVTRSILIRKHFKSAFLVIICILAIKPNLASFPYLNYAKMFNFSAYMKHNNNKVFHSRRIIETTEGYSIGFYQVGVLNLY